MIKYEDNLAARLNGNNLQPLAGASVTVTDKATGLPASLYQDDELTPIPQPLTTDNNGYFSFKAADGKYTLTFAQGANSSRFDTFTREIVLEDPADNPFMTKQELALVNGATKIGYGSGRTVSDKLGEVVSVKDFEAKGDGVADDTAAIQAAINAYDAAMVQYQAAAPNVIMFSAPVLRFPAGRYKCGALTSSANALRICAEGAVIEVESGATWLTANAVTVTDISGLQISGGARHLVLRNNNADGAIFKIAHTSHHDTTDWPLICEPITPAGAYEVNHLSGILTLTDVRWYNTNGLLKSYFDRTTVRDSYATLFASGGTTGGRWQADRSAIESRSLGDGVVLDNLFGVAMAQNGNFGNAWIDNYPGDAGWVIGSSGGAFDTLFIGGTAPVSFGGGVHATNCRFGTEDGGVPIVRNWCHGLGGNTGNGFGSVYIVLDNCFQMASGNGGTTTNSGAVILKKGVPNAIVIRNSKGPVGESMINADSMLDLAGAASNLAYWLDAARCGNYRCTIEIEGINHAIAGYATLVPNELKPFARYDTNEDGRVRTVHLPMVDRLHVNGGHLTAESDQNEFFVKGTAWGGALRLRGNSAAATDRNISLGRTNNVGVYTPFLTIDADTGQSNFYMPGSATPPNNGEMTFQLTSNTQLTVKVKGSDGVVRSVNLTLA